MISELYSVMSWAPVERQVAQPLFLLLTVWSTGQFGCLVLLHLACYLGYRCYLMLAAGFPDEFA